jgi:transaldolase
MNGEHHELRERLLFGTEPAGFAAAADAVRQRYADEYPGATPDRRVEIAGVLGELAIDLGSYLTRWHLLPPEGDTAPGQDVVDGEVLQLRELLRGWGHVERLEAVDAELASIAASNLRRLSVLTDEGRLASRWGHDAATGLTWAIRRGAILVTTNPVMVNGVRKGDPGTWDPVRDAIKAAHPDATPEQRASIMTMDVVLDECRELRPIWTATGGRYGYVSLQVSPRANDDPEAMATEVEDLYERLRSRLGGTPNSVFKIPGTPGGLDAVRRLTDEGIGVNVTLNASVDQQLAFAAIIEQGRAPVSFLTLMMGRLEDPVREELVAAGVEDATDVSHWASVAVLRRAYRLLFQEHGYRRSGILAASMRGPWTIEGSIVDEPPETYISCFPGPAADYDSVVRPIRSRVREPLPDGIEATLEQSETFRLAYGVGALTIDGLGAFKPVTRTLEEFTRHYDEFVDYNR